jgi:aromatic-amino-acid transaminase
VRAIVTPIRSSPLIPAAAGRSGDDPIFALNAEATARAKRGESILNATLGALMEDDGTLAVMPSVLEAISRVPAKRSASYAPILGEGPFLAAVIQDLFGDGALAEQAVAAATPGGTGALHHAIVNFLEPGQSVLTTSYFWGPYLTIATHTGRGLSTFPTFESGLGSPRFHVDAFRESLERQLAAQGRALVLLNYPCHNPTGYSLDDAEWTAIADVVRSAGEKGPVAFLLDHAYARFGTEASQGWVRHAERILDSATLLVAWTASKSFAQYGARVGALVAVHPGAAQRESIRAALGFSCRGTWSNCNHLGQLAITSLLVEEELRTRASRERAALIALVRERAEAFNREAGAAKLAYPRYEGGFFVSVFTPDAETTARSMREEGVYVVPMKGAVRVALCSTPARDVPRLVRALAAGVARAEAGR